MIAVSDHAVARYIERIDPGLTWHEAEARIRASEEAVRQAAKFGCGCVIQGDGTRLVLSGSAVVTVLAKGQGKLLSRPHGQVPA